MNIPAFVLASLLAHFAQASSLQTLDRNLYKAFGFVPIVEIEYRSASVENGFPNDLPFELHFTYSRDLSSETLIKAAAKQLDKIGADTRPHAETIERLNQSYRDVSKSDQYRLSYLPQQGTRLYLNGDLLFESPGHDFARCYFSIWLETDSNGARLRR